MHLEGILLASAAIAVGCALVGIVTMMSLAARVKVEGWWKNSLILRFFFWVGRGCRQGAGAVSTRVKEKNQEKAEKVIANDDVIDDLYDEIKMELIEAIQKDANNGEQATDLLMVAKYLERIGDHATNIAEWVIFSITGKHED